LHRLWIVEPVLPDQVIVRRWAVRVGENPVHYEPPQPR
jgi:hypothetical protein